MGEPPLGEDPCGGLMGDTQKLFEKHHAIIKGPLGDAWGIPMGFPQDPPPGPPLTDGRPDSYQPARRVYRLSNDRKTEHK